MATTITNETKLFKITNIMNMACAYMSKTIYSQRESITPCTLVLKYRRCNNGFLNFRSVCLNSLLPRYNDGIFLKHRLHKILMEAAMLDTQICSRQTEKEKWKFTHLSISIFRPTLFLFIFLFHDQFLDFVISINSIRK